MNRIPFGLGLAIAAVGLAWSPACSALDAPPTTPLESVRQPREANFLGAVGSAEVHHVAHWIVGTSDNGGLPFAIIDKTAARVFVFDRTGRLRGTSFALFGSARGDDTAPGMGTRKLSAIRPEERTTPAGRFVAQLGRDFEQDILWIDYETSLSLHRVVAGGKNDHRLERLATPSPLDNKISYGCVNVPALFFDQVVLDAFTGTKGIVYILPQVKTIQDVFGTAMGG